MEKFLFLYSLINSICMQCQKMQTDNKLEAEETIGVSQRRSKYVVYV
jgi:hypothetical protein